MFEWFRRRARDRFAQRVMQAIAAAGGPADFIYDPEKFTLTRANAIANLGNSFRAYSDASGAQRERVFQNLVAAYTATAAEPEESFVTVREKLVAVVRERFFLAVMQGSPVWSVKPGRATPNPPVAEPLSAWFGKTIVIDYPTHVKVVSESHLKDWGVTFDEAFAIGLRKLQEGTVPRFRHEKGVYTGTWSDDYDSSRVLVPSLFDDLPLDGAPVVCLPNRLTLLVAGANDHAAVKAMLARAEEIVQTVAKPQNPGPSWCGMARSPISRWSDLRRSSMQSAGRTASRLS